MSMNRSVSTRAVASILFGAGLFAFGCSGAPTQTNSSSPTDSSSDVGQEAAALRRFCGNNHCDHVEHVSP